MPLEVTYHHNLHHLKDCHSCNIDMSINIAKYVVWLLPFLRAVWNPIQSISAFDGQLYFT